MVGKLLKKLDYFILIIIFILFGIGILALYSAGPVSVAGNTEFSKQMVWFGIGFLSLIFFTFFDYSNLKKLWIPLYLLFCVLLFAVLFVHRNNGATSWFKIGAMSFQPAEFFKIIEIISLAFLIEYFNEKNSLNK